MPDARHRGRQRQRRGVAPGIATAVVAALSASCADPPPVVVDGVVSLIPVAESRAPYTLMGEIALADEGTACVIDSYQYKVYCADRGKKLWAFGNKGEGPGEFLGPTSIFRDPTGSIAVLDAGKSRVSIFEVTGAFLSESAIPLLLGPMGHLTSTLAAVVHDPGAGFRQVEVDIASGKITWDHIFSADLVDCGSGGILRSLGIGIPTPGDGIAFTTCGGRFVVWFDHRDDRAPSSVYPTPTYVEQFPGPEQVAAFIDARKRSEWMGAPSEAEIDEYRNTPAVWYQPPHRLDDGARLWTLSRRAGDDVSFIDVHEKAGYVGTVRVRHGAVGFDLLGTTLVVFVERPSAPDDPAGIPRSGIDWYDIAELDFGS